MSREKNGKSEDGQAGLLAGAFVLIWGITDESEACWRQNLRSPGNPNVLGSFVNKSFYLNDLAA